AYTGRGSPSRRSCRAAPGAARAPSPYYSSWSVPRLNRLEILTFERSPDLREQAPRTQHVAEGGKSDPRELSHPTEVLAHLGQLPQVILPELPVPPAPPPCSPEHLEVSAPFPLSNQRRLLGRKESA